jgi:dUTPase
VKEGDRIAQIIFEKIYIPKNVQEIPYSDLQNYAKNTTARGLNGFGSTGVSV